MRRYDKLGIIIILINWACFLRPTQQAEKLLSSTNKQTFPHSTIPFNFWIKATTISIQLQKSINSILGLISPQPTNKIILNQEIQLFLYPKQSECQIMIMMVLHKMLIWTNYLPKAKWRFTDILNSFKDSTRSIFSVLNPKSLSENARWEIRYHLKF